jgi:hypothetical protein
MNPLEDTWIRIGLLLVLIQNTEHAINASLSWVFADQPVTLEQIAFFEKLKQKRTLGRLLRELRERVNVDRRFDGLLTSFLQDRNRFVHSLFIERGFSINEAKNVPRIRKFVDSLTDRAVIVLAAFNAFIEIWAAEHDLAHDQRDAFQPAPELMQMIDHFKRRITQQRKRKWN